MIILGVDPGTIVTGYGVISVSRGKMTLLKCGVIKNGSAQSLPIRLKAIYSTLFEIIETYHPDEFAIETAFYGKNAQSAMKLGHARGVSLLAAVNQNIPTAEYSPREVKKAVVGNGAASKEQVQFMVKSLLRMKTAQRRQTSYDPFDALAVAICHCHRVSRPQTRFKNWKFFIKAHPEKQVRRFAM